MQSGQRQEEGKLSYSYVYIPLLSPSVTFMKTAFLSFFFLLFLSFFLFLAFFFFLFLFLSFFLSYYMFRVPTLAIIR